MIKIQWLPKEEANESGVAKEHLEDCRDSDGSLDFTHPHLTSIMNDIQIWIHNK